VTIAVVDGKPRPQPAWLIAGLLLMAYAVIGNWLALPGYRRFLAQGHQSSNGGADLALIGAAQKVEHYEMAGHITARNLAQQLQMPNLVQLLQLSLAEEENADQLLNQLARPLMSAARMPEPVA